MEDIADTDNETKNENSAASSEKKSKRGFNCKSIQGFTYAVLSTFTGSISSVFIKLASGARTDQIQLARLYAVYLVVLPYLTYSGKRLVPSDKTTVLLLLVREVIGSIATIAYTASLKFMPLGDAISIMYTYVLFVGILAWVFLKESCTAIDVILSITTIAGVVFVAQPPFIFGSDDADETQYQRGMGVAMALTASISLSITYLVIRKMGPAVHCSLSLFYLAWCGLLIIIVYMISTGSSDLPCLVDVLHVLGSAGTGVLSMLFVTLALQKERAGPVTMVNTTEVIFSFAFQLIFFQQGTSLYSIVGAVLIFVSALVLTIRNIRKGME